MKILRELIFEQVLLPIIHDRREHQFKDGKSSSSSSSSSSPLSISVKELLLMTNYHHYSSCLGSHCILEKELSAFPQSHSSIYNSFYHDEKYQVLSFTTSPLLSSSSSSSSSPRLVSTRAENWIQWMEENSNFSVVDLLLLGNHHQQKNQQKKKKKIELLWKSGYMDPSLVKLLDVKNNNHHVSRLRVDLLERGYDFSKDLLTVVKV